MWGRRDNGRSSQKKELEELFRKYNRKGDGLDKDKLRKAFHQLGAQMPFKHAEEALKVADKNKDGHISTDDEFSSLTEYAINNGLVDNY